MASIKFFEQNMLCGILPYAHCTVEYITIELPYPICSSKREKKKKKRGTFLQKYSWKCLHKVLIFFTKSKLETT